MKIACALFLLSATAMPLRAQDADPLKSPACGAALSALQAARTSGSDRVATLRDAAASACLGSAVVPPRPARVLQAPVAVPPPPVDGPMQVAPMPAPVLPPPPVAIQRAPLPATCDPGGCWTSDGTRLRHVPPSLAGPSGICTQQGGLVYCP